ncbi:hypothetical protein KSF85_11390 [Acinetobacter baumannii]|uniref:hypothetical protein n=1 Tax=Acinetobacter baumannii TaxID=470 RepID=UPI000DEEC050|nr:hypothetical protein [Acinetobacter baumannii]MBY7688181.1 hypothetical protein [Acinetobacter baumannii]
MDFNKIKIDRPRSIITYFDYFKDNMLDFHTAMASGGFATLSDISYLRDPHKISIHTISYQPV